VTRYWLFADQLEPHFLDEADQPVLLIESRVAFARRPVHRRRAHRVLWLAPGRAHQFAANPRMARQVQGANRLSDLPQVVEQEKRRGSSAPWR
jgi:deoxyribodipyrimidine photolyase-related protein